MTLNHRRSSRSEPPRLRSDDRVRSIVEHATDIIARFDRGGRHLYVNPAAERVTGRTADTFIGRRNREMGMPKALAGLWNDKLQRVFETGQGQEIEFDFPGAHGDDRTFRSRLVPEWGPDGRVETVLAIARDVTGRRRMEERLKVSEERFRVLVEGSRRNGLTIKSRIPSHLPPIHADPRRLIQVFQNLVGNPIKVTPEGGRVSLEARSAGDEVRFTVSDTGPGIPPEHLDHLFDRFWQADRSRGTGAWLGLATTKGIVEAHGGRIVAESTVGAGTTFRFTVPVSDTPDG